MPRVPVIGGPGVAPTALPGVRQQPPQTELLDIRNRQVGGLGQTTERAGSILGQAQDQLIQQANVLRVEDAYNIAQEAALRLQHDPAEGYTSLKGYDALNAPDGQGLIARYTANLDKTIAQISDGLGNEQQKQMFARRATVLRTGFTDGAMQYTAQQSQVYGMSVRDASVTNAQRSLAINANDPGNVQLQTVRIRAAVEGGFDSNGTFIPGSAQMAGKSAAWAKEKADQDVSGAHTAAVQGFIERGDVNSAAAYRKKYSAEFVPSDTLKIDGILQRNYDTMQGATAGDAVMSSSAVQSSINPTDYDRLRFTRTKLESADRGDFNPDGTLIQGPVTASGERAQGAFQVMPSTARNPGYGIKPIDPEIEKNGTPAQKAAEYRRIGDAKLDVLLKMFDGNVAKTLGAYNWGEGNVKKAEQQARDAAGKGEAVPSDAWLAYAPAETRNYVEKGMKMYGSPSDSAPPRPTLEQVQAQARDALGPNASALAVQTATATVTARYEVQTKAINQHKDELVALTMQGLDKNGGRFSELDPKLRSDVMRQAPEKVPELIQYGQRVAKGDDITDQRLYLRLSNDPTLLKGMSDQQFYALRKGLSNEDFKYFSNVRAQQINGKSGDSAGDINEQAINRNFNQRLQSLGIQVNPDKRNESEQMRVGAMRSFVDKSVMAAQRQVGRKLTDMEVAKVIDETFAMNVTFRTTFFGVETGTKSGSVLTVTVDTMPKDEKEKIRAAYARNGISDPTDGQILGVYFEAQAVRNKQKATTPAAGPKVSGTPASATGGASGSY